MKTVLFGLLFLTPFVVTQTCPTQGYPPIPAGVDMAQVAINPASPNQERLLLGVVKIALGQTASFRGYGCDPDGDPMVFTKSAGTLDVKADNTYTLTYKPTSVGVHYVHISCSDVRTTNDALTATGTVAVVVIPANRPPTCGALP